MYKKIIVPCEAPDSTTHALDRAVALAKAFHANLIVLGIYDAPPGPILRLHPDPAENEEIAQALTDLSGRIRTWAQGTEIPIKIETRTGNPIHLVVEVARQENADLIVLGDTNHQGRLGSFLKHNAEDIGLHVRCDLLLVR